MIITILNNTSLTLAIISGTWGVFCIVAATMIGYDDIKRAPIARTGIGCLLLAIFLVGLLCYGRLGTIADHLERLEPVSDH